MYLKITDGTTTLDLLGNDSTNSFNLLASQWAPDVAKRGQASQRFGDVNEALPLYAKSDADAATVLANLDILATLMDQAQRWALGENVDPVVIRYSPNSDLVYLQAVILGPPDEGAGLVLPETFSDDLFQKTVDGIVLQFKRRGLWLGAEESQVSSSAAENPVVNTATFTGGALTVPSPVKLDIEFTNGAGVEGSEAFAFIADDADKLYLSTELLSDNFYSSTSTITASHTDTTASAGETLMIQPNDTIPVDVKPKVDHDFPDTPGNHIYMFFMVLRNNSSSIHWDISQMDYTRPGSSVRRTKTFNNIRIEAGANEPQIVTIGPLAFDHPLGMGLASGRMPRIYVTPSAGLGSGHELEVDTIAIVNLDVGVTTLTIGDVNFSAGDTHTEIDHSLLTRVKPSVYAGQIGSAVSDHSIDYKGLPYIFNNTAEISALILGVQDGRWQLNWSSSDQPVDVRIRATRRPAHLVPQ